ncbi:DUF262 domain-containing protein [Pectobacterium versatile]|uniref:DUF262 domain-containing protein n=1 Tax=Pectobacterium versatile TaxID=2488639 RepID=UPI000DE5EDFE|nr:MULTISPECIES: DUF262 domain-containing protein [Pectobacterium]MCL6364844.1 DUF262 domain-containing protein [Pectobacterium carotovorum subsp. carotovorum]PVY72990.1 uncharacterized protein with ParB-like and HNH nuclease domain [Pectobacterium versatile]GKV82893.1 hypothetical protein PEC106664_36670 [Pectobacterium carotovorum subsp. carotovorum]
MNTRELTQDESDKVQVLRELGIDFELLFVTGTGLTKSILDATSPIIQLLKNKQIHDYDSQKSGSEYKVMLPCIVLSNGTREETKSSLYKANTRGDTRFWPGRFNHFATDGQAFAMFIENRNLILLNLSDGQPLDTSDGSDFSEIVERISVDSDELVGVVGSGEDTKVENDDSSERDMPSRFEVSSYGWDSDVEGLVKRLNRGDIKLPGFQRGFVWSLTEQSRFIESLILGLPVPNIFLAQDRDSKTLNIIDGQQRLKTLQRYLAGDFSISNSKKIHEDLRGCYFNADVAKSPKSRILDDADVRTLSDSVLHSIVIRPDPSSDSPDYGYEYNDAVIQIFRRLNTSGTPLQPQEVRSCIFYGDLDSLLHKLNDISHWRDLFGPKHSRYKDIETILRFMALYEDYQNYKAPMPSFLDRYMEKNRNMAKDKLDELEGLFEETTGILSRFDSKIFKKGGTFLLSKFDSIMVGVAKALKNGVDLNEEVLNNHVEKLISDEKYINSTEEFVNDTENVINRINVAIKIFVGA